ncbi:PIN domain-containing protein [uncultured Thiodictyon sp.]|uniref:PIN domain-containing protein n=1 Tax=uncultured Thiodictyon sp. TaxID=1846217 RepID=UPI0026012D90|nr:PIN domain-containing protein [uncultured Thiodictyon sp.]
MIETYLDTNILIVTFRSDHPAIGAAMSVLGDPQRAFFASHYLRLETLRKPMFDKREDEMEFIAAYFDAVSHCVPTSDALTVEALQLAAALDLGATDALHVTAALRGGAEEFITLERPSKSICRIHGLRTISPYLEATSK